LRFRQKIQAINTMPVRDRFKFAILI